jgi:hypothetical protein
MKSMTVFDYNKNTKGFDERVIYRQNTTLRQINQQRERERDHKRDKLFPLLAFLVIAAWVIAIWISNIG